MKELQNINRYISDTSIFGVIPLDLTLHFLIGAFLTILLLKLTKLGHLKVLFLIITIAFFKELYDAQVMTATLREAVEDFLATIFYPILAFTINKMLKD